MIKYNWINDLELKKIYFKQRQGDGSMMIEVQPPPKRKETILHQENIDRMSAGEYLAYLMHEKYVAPIEQQKDTDEEFHEKVIEILERESKKKEPAKKKPIRRRIIQPLIVAKVVVPEKEKLKYIKPEIKAEKVVVPEKEKPKYIKPEVKVKLILPWSWVNLADIFGEEFEVKALKNDNYRVILPEGDSFFIGENYFEKYLIVLSQTEAQSEKTRSRFFNCGYRTRAYYKEETGKIVRNAFILDFPVEEIMK